MAMESELRQVRATFAGRPGNSSLSPFVRPHVGRSISPSWAQARLSVTVSLILARASGLRRWAFRMLAPLETKYRLCLLASRS